MDRAQLLAQKLFDQEYGCNHKRVDPSEISISQLTMHFVPFMLILFSITNKT